MVLKQEMEKRQYLVLLSYRELRTMADMTKKTYRVIRVDDINDATIDMEFE
jgi:hypothetical protein